MTTVTLPPAPGRVPDLTVDPAGIRAYGTALLAGSAQIDDLGSFVAGPARIPDFEGQAATAYAAAIEPIGHRADAMSLALRGVAQRVDVHAERMESLVERHTDLQTRAGHLSGVVTQLRGEVPGLTEADVPEFQARCDDVTRQVRGLAADMQTWAADVATEEQAMRAAFDRVLSVDQVEHRYGGVADPADAALATKPGPGAGPAEVFAWWSGLTRAQQQAILAAAPGAIGNLDGVPPWARDAANRVALSRDLADWGNLDRQGLLTDDEKQWYANAQAAQCALDRIGAGIDPVTGEPIHSQVYVYDPTAFGGDGRVAIAAGDLDTADNVSVVVPGLGTDAQSADYQAARAQTLYESSRFLDPSQSNASLFWIGYDAPDNVPWDGSGWDAAGVAGEYMAGNGGDLLSDTIDGLRASHSGAADHLTVIGHSYGSTTVGIAAHDHGLPADDIVLVGSPGAGGDADHASDLHLDPGHVWVGSASRDPVSWLGDHGWVNAGTLTGGGGLGTDPSTDDFGAHRFQAEATDRATVAGFGDHSKYFDHGSESLANISEVVNGHYDAVTAADHRYDPWWGPAVDPEFTRHPHEVRTR